jgi:formylglycine-generating enzyme required for sulfatase activity
MAFLDTSREAAERAAEEREATRQQELGRARQLAEAQARVARLFKRFAGGLVVVLCLAVALTIWALMLRQEAIRQEQEAIKQEAEAKKQRVIAEDEEKKTKALELVQLLLTVDTPSVAAHIAKLGEHRQLSDPMLREFYEEAPPRSSGKLHASLALLPVDPRQVDYLLGRLLEADARELPVIRDALAPHKDGLLDRLWAVQEKPQTGKESQRLRAAAALAAYDPESERWVSRQAETFDFLSTLQEKAVRAPPGYFRKDGTTVAHPIVEDGAPRPHSLFMHPPANGLASVYYELDRPYAQFVARVGIPALGPEQQDPKAPVTFQIIGNGRMIWQSRPFTRRGDIEPCRIGLAGINQLELRVFCAGRNDYAWAVWLEPKLTREQKIQDIVVKDLVAAPAAELNFWKEALRPVRRKLLAPLSLVYRSTNQPAQRSLATDILADYAADQPILLANLLLDADEKQFTVIYPKLKEHGKRGVPILAREIGRELTPAPVTTDWTVRFYNWDDAQKDKPVRKGLSVQSELTATDPTEGGRHAKTYTFKMTAGKNYVIDLMTREGNARTRYTFDPYLRLLDPDGRLVAQDDDSGGFPNARINFLCVKSGTYKIIATTFQPNMTGKFLLTAREGSKKDMALARLQQEFHAYWEAVLKKPVRDELRMPRLHLADANIPPRPPTPKVAQYFFAAVATTKVTLEADEYVIKATSDDWVRVWLDDEVLLESWSAYAPVTKSATIRNKRGNHVIKVEYFQAAGGYHLDIDLAVSGDALAKRQVNAAVALLEMNQPSKVWPLLKHSPDPRVRSYLIHALSPLGADAKAIVKQLERDSDPAIRGALLLSLGQFGEKVTPDKRRALLPKLQDVYKTAADPGLHAASEWLLRQWKEDAWLKETNQAWAGDKEQQSKRLEDAMQELKKETKSPERRWYVNGQGQTLVVIPGPVEFWMGSLPAEEGRLGGPEGTMEQRHWRRIGRSFAIASKEVTVEQFLRFRKDHPVLRQHATSDDSPVNMVTWYDAAAYCNWLSEQEGIPKEQWCYEPNKEGKYAEGMKMASNYLQRTGYRLPTEAEWEYSCRADAVTRFSFGESEKLLPRYAWYQNSQNRSGPVGSMKPNDLGLFDMHGNIWQWCQDAHRPYGKRGDGKAMDDIEDKADIINTEGRVMRGGSWYDVASLLRSAYRDTRLPTVRPHAISFRPARTLPFTSFDRYAAARAAARAAAGQNKKKPPQGEAAKAKLRRQTLGWLKAELTNWSKVQPPRVFIARNLWHWQEDRALAGIRDQAALAKLPPEEQKVFTQFWADVAKATEPANSAERLDFARVAVLICAGQGKDEPPPSDAAKAKLRGQALDWLKAELIAAPDRAVKAGIIAAAAPLPDLLEKLAKSAANDGPFQAELARHLAERGHTAQATLARSKARTLFEAKLAKEPDNFALAAQLADLLLLDSHWTVLKPAEMKSQGGATLTLLDDGSILAGGTNPDRDVYSLVAKTDLKRIYAIRLEAMPDPSLPKGGPGRFPGNGNFHLSKLHVFSGGALVPLTKIIVTYSETAAFQNVIGGIDSSIGWSNPRSGGGANAAVVGARLERAEDDDLKIELFCSRAAQYAQHNLGRFRLSVSADPAAVNREEKRLAVLKFTDPWSKLAAAYALDGRNDKALETFATALRVADGRTAKAAVIAAAALLPGLLEKLAESAPNDGPFQAELAWHFAERGDKPKADAARAKARALFEKQLAKEPQNSALAAELAQLLFDNLGSTEPEWIVLKPAKADTESGAKLTLKEDGSILVAAAKSTEQQSVRWQPSPKLVRAVRIETSTHAPRSPRNLEGTTWAGQDGAEFFTYHFETNGVLAYEYRGNFFRTGKWTQDGDKLHFEMNNKYRECRALIRGNVIEGDSWNKKGAKWKTKLLLSPTSGTSVFNEYRTFAADMKALRGRFVRLDLPGDNRQFPRWPADQDKKSINLAELQVFHGDKNIALRKKARQSSNLLGTAFGDGSRLAPENAVDGNTAGNDQGNPYAHTGIESDPWWEVDLGGEQTIDRIVIWNRIEPGQYHGLYKRMNHFRIRVLDQSRKVVFEQMIDKAPNPSTQIVPQAPLADMKSGENQPLIVQLPRSPFKDAPSRYRVSVATSLADLGLEDKLQEAMKVADAEIRLALAYALNGRNDKAAEYYRKGLKADPTLVNDRQAQHRYHAARAAALAAAGQVKDVPPLGDAAKAQLRRQALDWLKAELTAWSKLVKSGTPQTRQSIVQTLNHWLKDSDLAGIRDLAALDKLPADEKKACTQLWAGVAALLKKAEARPK